MSHHESIGQVLGEKYYKAFQHFRTDLVQIQALYEQHKVLIMLLLYHLFVCLSVCESVCRYVCLSVCLSVCLNTYIFHLNQTFTL